MIQNECHPAPNKTATELRGSDTGICPQCGHALKSTGLEEFLSRLGITEEMLSNLKSQFQNLDTDEYLNTAREYLKQSGDNVQLYMKENPAKVAVGVAALAFGACLVWGSAHQARTEELEDRFRQLELKRVLAGPKYSLDEVLSELGVAV